MLYFENYSILELCISIFHYVAGETIYKYQNVLFYYARCKHFFSNKVIRCIVLSEQVKKILHRLIAEILHYAASVDDAEVLEDARVLSRMGEREGAIFGKRGRVAKNRRDPRVCVCVLDAFKHSFGRQKRQSASEWRSARIVSQISRRERTASHCSPPKRDHRLVEPPGRSRVNFIPSSILRTVAIPKFRFDRLKGKKYERCVGEVRQGESTADGDDATG